MSLAGLLFYICLTTHTHTFACLVYHFRALRVKRSDTPEDRDDIEVATLLQRKGEAHLYKKEYVRAKATFDSAMQIQKKLTDGVSGTDSMSVASLTYCLGVAYYYLNDASTAKLLFQECMRIQLKFAKGGNNETNSFIASRSFTWMGRVYEKMNKPQSALEQYLYALQVCKKNKSVIDDYRVVVILLHSIGKLYEDDKVDQPDMSLKCKY